MYVNSYRSQSDDPLKGSEQQAAPALVADPTDGVINVRSADWVVAGPEITVEIVAPDGMTQLQIGFDPSFSQPTWQDMTSETTVTSRSAGYQTIFARFRKSEDAQPSSVVVTGVMIDPTFQQAVTGEDGSAKEVSWVRPLSPTAVMVRIEDGRVRGGRQETYDFEDPPADDEVYEKGGLLRATRNGREYGEQASGTESVLTTYDEQIGRSLDPEGLDTTTWTVSRDGIVQELPVVQRISTINGRGGRQRRANNRSTSTRPCV